jgi:hypothetical protein
MSDKSIEDGAFRVIYSSFSGARFLISKIRLRDIFSSLRDSKHIISDGIFSSLRDSEHIISDGIFSSLRDSKEGTCGVTIREIC